MQPTTLLKNMFKDWYPVLNILLNSMYFDRLIYKMEELYNKTPVYPRKKEVFKAFQLTSWDSLKVVILGQDPYYNGAANGLAFANSNDRLQLSSSLEIIKKTIEKTCYGGFNIDFDQTLEHWATQGILLLNTALTVQAGMPNSHKIYWDRFTREVISSINNKNNQIIFVLWGGNAKYYKRYIDNTRHYVLESTHPAFAARKNKEWECNHFQEINEILTKKMRLDEKHKILW